MPDPYCFMCRDTHPTKEGITYFTREFECPECGEAWTDEWCADCNDRCPNCNLECSGETVNEEVIVEPEE